MKKPVFKRVVNAVNYHESRKVLETNPDNLPSQTVPDMSLTLRQMLDRHNSGGRVKSFEPVYVGESNVIPVDLERMDKIDLEVLRQRVADNIAVGRGTLISQREAKLRASKEAFRKAVKSSVDDDFVEPVETDL